MPSSRLAQNLIKHHISTHSETDRARQSFAEYLKLCGRTEHGAKLRLDPPILDAAALLEKAYRTGKDFCGFRSRSLLKSTMNVAFMAWVLGHDPNLSIIYITNTEELAGQRNRWLQSVLSTDDHRRCFPDATALKSGCRAFSTVVKGKTDKAAPNVHAVGIDGARAGPHFDMVILDDVCDTRNSLAQPARKELNKQMYHTSIRPELNRRTLDPSRTGLGMMVFTGTSYAVDDLNADIDRAAAADVENRTWIYDRVACGGPPDFKSPCPTILSSDDLRTIYESNNRAYEMNYMLLPMMDSERPFREIFWYVDEWDFSAKQLEDLGDKRPLLLPKSEGPNAEKPLWPRVMVVDPGFKDKSGSSCTGIVIGIVGPEGMVYVPYGWKVKQPWDKTVHELPSIYFQHKCSRFLIEDAGTQVALQSHLRDLGIPYVEGVGAASRSKEIRAQDVATPVNSGQVRLRGHLQHDARSNRWSLKPGTKAMGLLADDLLAWPGVLEKDFVDAFVYLVQTCCESGRPIAETPRLFKDREAESWARLAEEWFGDESDEEPRIEEADVFAHSGSAWWN